METFVHLWVPEFTQTQLWLPECFLPFSFSFFLFPQCRRHGQHEDRFVIARVTLTGTAKACFMLSGFSLWSFFLLRFQLGLHNAHPGPNLCSFQTKWCFIMWNSTERWNFQGHLELFTTLSLCLGVPEGEASCSLSCWVLLLLKSCILSKSLKRRLTL